MGVLASRDVVLRLRPALALFLTFALVFFSSGLAFADQQGHQSKFDRESRRRANAPTSRTRRVIVRLKAGQQLPSQFAAYVRPNSLNIVNSVLLDLPESKFNDLAASVTVDGVSTDRAIHAHNFRTSVTSGAFFARQLLGYTGAGVGVAVLDSGVSTFHDDFTVRRSRNSTFAYGNQRVAVFKDFVNNQVLPYDDNGHGTHVAGTIAGNGFDSRGEQAGMAPESTVISLKVLDANGVGSVSNVIAALSWVSAHARQYNIRVVNMSIGAAVLESYKTDPLTLATKALVDQGIVVVTAAGNFGKDSTGKKLWGGITAPGNAPWNLTIGASSTKGTFIRGDDEVASFSSKGPTWKDFAAKPDLLASGVGTVSTIAPGSTYYNNYPQFRQAGAFPTANSPYFVLSGTSQAVPVVSGTIALMLQANPKLTPNLVKAILQYTSQKYDGIKPLEQGAGFLNSLGAVRLSAFYKEAKPGQKVPVDTIWSQHIHWGNHEIHNGFMIPTANAWNLGVTWGSPKTQGDDGDNIIWGTSCKTDDCGDNIIWGTSDDGDNIIWGTGDDGDNIIWGTKSDGDNIIWGTGDDGDNIIWGTDCGGADCGDNIIWGTDGKDGDNIIWGTAEDGDNIIWGTDGEDGDNIIWGTDGEDGDNIIWGTNDGDNIIWGTNSDGDNIIWGTDGEDGDNIIWGTDDGDNIIWGTDDDGDNIIWGTPFDGDNIIWGTAGLPTGPKPPNGWYRWFLNKQNERRWVRGEFGAAFRIRTN